MSERGLPGPAVQLQAQDPQGHVRPFVQAGGRCKALHFSIREVQSRMRLDDPYALDLDYSRTMMGFLLFKPAPQRIAMIGLGGGSLAKFCHRHLLQARIQVVEINPHVIALRDEFLVPPDDARLQVLQGDGADFVRDPAQRSDVLLVDGFDYDGQPSRLSSQAFYDDCHEHLLPDGLLVVNLHTGDAHCAIFVERMRRSFGDALLLVECVDLGNTVVFASKGGAFAARRRASLRPPGRLDAVAAGQLQGSFAHIRKVLRRVSHQSRR
jgi:spermidine synthase